VLRDWRTAPVSDRVRAALGFLEAVTMRPAEVTDADLRPLLAAGVGSEEAEEALLVAFCFNLIDRIADALGFVVVTPERFDRGADHLLKRGYL
jgi:alkylhydroperoxidase family enzyme